MFLFNITSVLKRLLFLHKAQVIEETKMTIVVRSDIVMGKGKVGAQCAHAAIECYRKGIARSKYKEIIETWVYQGQPKIILKIPNEAALYNLQRDAQAAGLITAIIKDAGKTQLRPGTVSVLAIGPGSKSVIDKLTDPLKLL